MNSTAIEHPATASSTAVVEAAVAQAKSLAAQASAAIPPLNSDVGAKFKRWFGGPEGNSDDTVKAIYDEVAAMLDINTFWCANRTNIGKEDTVAFVLRDSSREMFIMGAFFFDAPTSGFNSQAGSLVHEASHQSTQADVIDSDVTGDVRARLRHRQCKATSPHATRGCPPDWRRRSEYFAEDVAYSP